MRHRRRNGDFENEKALACAEGTRDIVIGAAHAGDARPSEDSDREPSGERNQKHAGATARREREERKRQPRGRRERTDKSQDGVNPIADSARPPHRDADSEAKRSTKKIAAR